MSLDLRVVPDQEGDLFLVWGDGRIDEFQRVGHTYVSPSGGADRLIGQLAGHYRLVSKEGVQYEFADP